MLNRIISLIAILASFFIPLQSHAFSIFDEGRIGEYNHKELSERSGKISLVNRLYFDVFSNDTFDATNRQNELLRSSSRADLVSKLHYDKKWFAYFNFRIEEQGLFSSEFRSTQVTPQSNGDQFFTDHSGVARELYFGYEDEDYKVYAGKFRPKFGYAWNLGRGIFSNSLASSYMQLERIGFGGEVKSGNKRTTGAYNLGLSIYKYDRKYLDNSLFTSRREVSESDGVASDTENPKSFTVNLDIDFDFDSGKELFYRFAYSKQKFDNQSLSNKASIQSPYQDQKGYSLAMNYKLPVTDDITVDALVEYVDTEFSQGDFNVNKDSVSSASLITNFAKNWNVTLASAQRRILANSGITLKTIESELTGGYNFDSNDYFDGLQIQLGFVDSRSGAPTSSSVVDSRSGSVIAIRYVKWL